MKKKEKTSLIHASKEELKKQINELQAKLRVIRLDRYTKQLKNTRELREIRRKIAVMQTYIHQKELAV